MAIVIDTATILEFWLDILNPFKICGQMIYRAFCLRPVSSNPVLGLEYQNTHSESYRVDMKIPFSDSESPLKTWPYDLQIILFGGGHLTFSSVPWIVLAITKNIEQVSTFCVQIWNIFKKWV
jgi:hypothetical protein